MSDMWMPPQTTRPPFLTALSAIGTSAPTGAKMIAASSGSGGISSGPAAPTAPKEFLNSRAASSPARGPGGDLRQKGRGGADPVEAEGAGTRVFAVGCGCARHPIAAPADQARTQERRNLGIVAPFRRQETVAGIGDRMGGVAAIARVAGKQRSIAQILSTAAAVGADTAGGAEPGHA